MHKFIIYSRASWLSLIVSQSQFCCCTILLDKVHEVPEDTLYCIQAMNLSHLL